MFVRQTETPYSYPREWNSFNDIQGSNYGILSWPQTRAEHAVNDHQYPHAVVIPSFRQRLRAMVSSLRAYFASSMGEPLPPCSGVSGVSYRVRRFAGACY